MDDDYQPWLVVPDLPPPPDGYTDVDKARDYRRVFGTPEGKRVLYDIMSRARIASPVFAPGIDTHAAAFQDGMRNLGAYILREMTRDVRPVRQSSTEE